MADSSEIDLYLLDTEFLNGKFIYRNADGTTEHWVQQETLGTGSQGYVYLQKEAATAQLRAVKRLMVDNFRQGVSELGRGRPGPSPSLEMMIKRELSVLAAVKGVITLP